MTLRSSFIQEEKRKMDDILKRGSGEEKKRKIIICKWVYDTL